MNTTRDVLRCLSPAQVFVFPTESYI